MNNSNNAKRPTSAKRNATIQNAENGSNTGNIYKNGAKTGRPLYQKRRTGYSSSRRTPPRKPIVRPSVKIAFLGGLNEIGKNITIFECQEDMFILDCGMAFPDGEMLGVDLVLPDFTYVKENVSKIKGIIITHGHEDHIGALPYLLKDVSIPVYGTPLSIGLIANKLKEHNLLSSSELHTVKAGDIVPMGCMSVELIHVNHSIPDSVGLAIHTPAGTIVHTGDFKIDFTPATGDVINLPRFAELGKEGVLALMADSTNAERAGFTQTEAKIKSSFENLFVRAKNKRIIIATFASNVNRIQQIIDCAVNSGRKIAFSGRSMLNYLQVATELGYIDVPKGAIVDIDALGSYLPEQIVIVTTGSQGEPMSALYRMAYSEHRKVAVGKDDFIIISAKPIPGNEKTVGNVIDELLKLGCEVIYESMYEVHVSGHACQEELKVIHNLVHPEFFIPVHGEQKHLKKHAELAESLGMSRENIFIGDIGNVVELRHGEMKMLENVPSGKVFVDGLGVGDVGSIVLRDRKHLGQDGLIVIVAALDIVDGYIVSGPDVVSRGFVYVRESEEIIHEVRRIAMEILQDFALKNIHEWNMIKNKIKEEVSKHIFTKTRRTPMILPIIMEV